MRFSRTLMLLTGLAALFTETLAQTGSVVKVLKEGQIRVVWDLGTSPPPAGSLGTVVERNRVLAVFRTQSSKKQESLAQLMDVVMPKMVKKDQKVNLLDLEPSSIPSDQSSILVWSDRLGSSFQVDGKPAGQAPARVILSPGIHVVTLDLTGGGRAGAKIEARLGEEAFVCLRGRSWPSPEKEDGYRWYIPFRVFETLPGRPLPLLWLEDGQGERVYTQRGPVKNPRLRKKVMPHYPESSRREGKEGHVWLDALIGTDGQVQQLDVMDSSDPAFTEAAKEAVLQWVYEPATLDGEPVRIFFTVIVDFYLGTKPLN